MSLTRAALNLPWPVFACGPDKRPATAHGFKDATRDPDTIRSMFDRPGATLIGVPTGASVGWIVVDVDNKVNRQGGQWLDANSHRMPQTRTIRTGSGGLHIYLRHPGQLVRNSNDKIAPGIDIRGDGGYVIVNPSPGYEVADDAPIAEIPSWLLPVICPPEPVYEPPQPTKAREHGGSRYGLSALQNECDAIRSAGFGNQEHTLNAAALKIGALVSGGEIEEGVALSELLAAGRGIPSQPGRDKWSPTEVEAKIRRAFADGRHRPRQAPPRPEYEQPEPPELDPGYWASVEDDIRMSADQWHDLHDRETGATHPASEEAKAAAGNDLLWSLTEPWVEADIPKRPWLAKGYLLRSAVTVLSGPGSAGKSSLMVAWSACMAVGCAFGSFRPTEALRVMTYNTEDDENEQKRRYSAIFRRLGVSPAAWQGRLAILGPTRVGTLLSTAPRGEVLVNTPVMDRLERFVAEFKPDVLMLDPFVELHGAEENDNTAVRAVLARFRAMAVAHNMSVVILHHARKGAATPGDQDSMRGASAIVGAARVALTVNVMNEEEASSLGIGNEVRKFFFRLDGAKSNYAPLDSVEWFERVSYELDNGDGVAAITPWKPPSLKPTVDIVTAALNGIANASFSGPWSPRLSDDPRSFKVLATRLGVDGQAAQKALLDTLVKDHGVVVAECSRGNGKARNDTMKGLRTADGAPHTADWV